MTNADIQPDPSAVAFFREHGSISWNPTTESKDDARERCAVEYATAEARAKALGWRLEIEPDGESYAWQNGGTVFDVVTRRSSVDDPEAVSNGYDVTLVDGNDKNLTLLGGVTFDNDDTTEPYARVLFAELALEALKGCALTNAEINPCPAASPDGYRCTRMRHDDPQHEARTDWADPNPVTWTTLANALDGIEPRQ